MNRTCAVDFRNDWSIEEMVDHYRRVRRSVFDQATTPISTSSTKRQNQCLLAEKVLSICSTASQDNFRDPEALWKKMWRIIRYAGFKAAIATSEIKALEPMFDGYERFCNPEWNPDSGRLWKAFLMNGTVLGMPEGRVRNAAKLRKTILVARRLAAFVRSRRGSGPIDAIDFVAGPARRSDWKAVHRHLLELGYTGDLTALHLMMDIGFPVVKPDIVLTKLMLRWGWLHSTERDCPSSRLPPDPAHIVLNKGACLYTRPAMYERVIDVANSVLPQLQRVQEDLAADIIVPSTVPIQLRTGNLLREFDIFLVKYGQDPDPAFGITGNLAAEQMPSWRVRGNLGMRITSSRKNCV